MSIAIDGLTFRYHRSREPVLRDVSLELHPGDFCALLGPNGSGKSSLAKSILGINRPQAGKISIDGRDLRSMSRLERARLLAYVPQSAELPFALSVYDAAMLGRSPHFGLRPRRADHHAVASALHRLGLWPLRHRLVTEISGGQAQRVAIARAIAQATPAILLDEPTSALDLRYQVETMQIIRGYADDGGMALMAVHDLNLAARHCTKVVILQDGRVRESGTPAQVFDAGLIGDVYGLPVEIDNAHGYIEIRPYIDQQAVPSSPP